MIVFVIALLFLIGGTSYAIYYYTGTGNKENVITTGHIRISFEENSEINISDRYPQSDTDGFNDSDPNSTMSFTITSDASRNATIRYAIGLVDISRGTTLTDEYIRIALVKDDEEIFVGRTIESFKNNFIQGYLESYVITQETITSNEEHHYTLKAWIGENFNLDKTTTVEGLNQGVSSIVEEYSFKIKVVGTNSWDNRKGFAEGEPELTLTDNAGEDLLDYRIYGNTIEEIETKLPDEYQEVEWIRGMAETSNYTSSSPAYIDTGLKATNLTHIKSYFYLTGASNAYRMFGVWDDNVGSFGLNVTNNPYDFIGRYGNVSGIRLASTSLGNHVFEEYDAKIYFDGILRATFEKENFVTTNNITILTVNDNGNPKNALGYNQKEFLIWEDDILVRDFIPCYRKSDGVIGMYDLCGSLSSNGTSFYSSPKNASKMTKGPDIISETSVGIKNLPSDYQQVDYIESHGTESIRTDFSFNLLDKVECEFAFTNTSASGVLFGFQEATMTNGGNSFLFGISSNGQWRWACGTESRNFGITDTNEHTVMFDNGNVYFDNNLIVENFPDNKLSDNINIFSSRRVGTDYTKSSAIIKKLVVTSHDSNEIIHYFIPCYRKSDGVIGMYDKISGIFYKNSGTGGFEKGADFFGNEYIIPITVSNSTDTVTTNIYLDEPLRKIGDYVDYIDFKEQKIYRNVRVIDESGTLPLEQSLEGQETIVEDIELPSILTTSGTSIISVGTDVKPSNMYVNFVPND